MKKESSHPKFFHDSQTSCAPVCLLQQNWKLSIKVVLLFNRNGPWSTIFSCTSTRMLINSLMKHITYDSLLVFSVVGICTVGKYWELFLCIFFNRWTHYMLTINYVTRANIHEQLPEEYFWYKSIIKHSQQKMSIGGLLLKLNELPMDRHRFPLRCHLQHWETCSEC